MYLFGRASLAEGTANAKAPRCKCVWSVRGKPRRPVGLEHSGRGGKIGQRSEGEGIVEGGGGYGETLP